MKIEGTGDTHTHARARWMFIYIDERKICVFHKNRIRVTKLQTRQAKTMFFHIWHTEGTQGKRKMNDNTKLETLLAKKKKKRKKNDGNTRRVRSQLRVDLREGISADAGHVRSSWMKCNVMDGFVVLLLMSGELLNALLAFEIPQTDGSIVTCR